MSDGGEVGPERLLDPDGNPRAVELGQVAFAGNDLLGYDCFDAEPGLRVLGELLSAQQGVGDGWPVVYGPDDVFENDVFTIRAYCWCDGDRHPDGCPPNFVHHGSGWTINWYKHVGRGLSSDRPFDRDAWVGVLWDCIRSIDPERPATVGGEVEPQRIEALLRWLTEEGHITPVGAMQVMKIVDVWAGRG